MTQKLKRKLIWTKKGKVDCVGNVDEKLDAFFKTPKRQRLTRSQIHSLKCGWKI